VTLAKGDTIYAATTTAPMEGINEQDSSLLPEPHAN
jgi:hypothetical protein